ncbi:tellurite resistance protein TerB [Alteromonadaceae bacterium 2753L.S.0a.02]|nr:tellurite resistance protein TerB [Alteromonadaceae bacterium 2753L.S.0a.02]
MHILIGIITAIAGLIWALHSLQNAGVDLNAFNPFTWARRRKWEKQLGTKPMHALTDTMEAAALLVVAVARQKGDITREVKQETLSLFQTEFGVNESRAAELFSASSHLITGVLDMALEVRHVLAPSKEDFQVTQVEKLLQMLRQIAALEGGANESQQRIIEAVRNELNPPEARSW